MKNIPYISITDFTAREQVERMGMVFETHSKPEQRRRLGTGVMMSYKTLHGHATKWSKAFPPKEEISNIFFPNERWYSFYCLHYADYEDNTTHQDLMRALAYAGPFVQGLQLDMPWPEPGMIASGVHGSRLKVEVILQVGARALEEADNDPIEVVRRLKDYDTVIDHVLLDKSMGRGLGMDAEGLIPFAHAIRDEFPDLGLVAAGGLGPDSLGLVEPLVREFPDISIDAQGKLRPSGNAIDPIDWDMAERYLVNALALLK